MKKLVILFVSIICFSGFSSAQTVTQTVKGKVVDQTTQKPIIGARIILLNSEPNKGTITSLEGEFTLENVPVGRQTIEISMLGYESTLLTNLLISSGKEVVLDIDLIEKATEMDEVVIVANKKGKPLNGMATVSSRQFTVEETQRYAGGLNDPARLVSSFAGVVTPSTSNNGISVRGNNPSGLLWRIEGVEIPSPNHFANLTIAGAGLLTVLSSQMMGNSDFYTGAFPAEYGNATSGVFDINLRKGNSSTREYTFQAGLLGLDFATEGPFRKGGKASYLVNYRYSTMALISPILPSNSGVLEYQDLSFKLNFPTKKVGTFSLWSISAYDGIDIEALDSLDWQSNSDKDNSQTALYMFATGLKHKIIVKSNAFLEISLSASGNGLKFKEQRLDDKLQPHPMSGASKNNYRITLQSSITYYYNKKHTNQTGFYYNHLRYNLNINKSITSNTPPINLINENGQSDLLQFYSQSKFKFSNRFTLNAGLHFQYFRLNNKTSLEPRIALKYQLNKNNSLAIAFGVHSKIESLPIYFVNKTGNEINKNLDLMKSNHFVISFNSMLSDNLKLSIEPYFQYLSNVPVSPKSYISTLNIQNSLFFNEELVSNGKGRNIGIDFTLEKYLSKGLYYLLSASIFDSKYIANDGIKRNTRYNKNYVFNILIGKEWQIGKDKNNLLSTNFRLNYLGGNRMEVINEQASIDQQEIVYGETNGNISFVKKYPDTPIFSFTVSYRKNKPKYSSIWTLQVLNASQTKEFESDYYNIKTNTIDKKFNRIMIPNLSYKMEF